MRVGLNIGLNFNKSILKKNCFVDFFQDLAAYYARIERMLYFGRDILGRFDPPVLKFIDPFLSEYVSVVDDSGAGGGTSGLTLDLVSYYYYNFSLNDSFLSILSSLLAIGNGRRPTPSKFF